jgi:signal transduction histidine kinase
MDARRPSVRKATVPRRSETASPTPLELADQELLSRLGWFTNLRWLAAICCAGVVLCGRYVFRLDLPMPELLAGVAFLLLYNTICVLVSRVTRLTQGVPRRRIILLANAQIALDLVALTTLLHFAGGVENLFLFFYVFHMVIASILLSTLNAALHATLAAALFNAVAWLEACGILPHVHLHPVVPDDLYRNGLFVFEVCFVLTVTLYITVYLASSIMRRLRQREREIQDAIGELRSLDLQKSFFMRKVSHELRSPLAAIQSLLQVILAGHRGSLEPGQAQLIQRADARAGELLILVNELLTYSRLRSASRLERREGVALSSVARKVVDLFAPMCDQKAIELTAEFGHAVVMGDDEALEELVSNLVSNAVRYTPQGGKIAVRTAMESGRVELEVRDTGIGIEPTELPHIFEEFHRTPRGKKFERTGTGLGLAIVRRVAEMHDGEVRVESTPDVGSTFRVSFPASGEENALPS